MRRLDTEIENFKRREEAAAQARVEILRMAQGQRTALATADEMTRTIREWRDTPSGFADLLGEGGPSDETANRSLD